MEILNSAEWCLKTLDEDKSNVLYANYTYEIDNRVLSSYVLKSFDLAIQDYRQWEYRTEAEETTSTYLVYAAEEKDLFFKGTEIRFPENGVARVISFPLFFKEYKSFLSGITTNFDNATKLHERLSKNDTALRGLIADSDNYHELKRFAKKHSSTLEAAVTNGNKTKLETDSFKETINHERITWVTKREVLEDEIRKPGNRANRSARVLGLIISLYDSETAEFPIIVMVCHKLKSGTSEFLYRPTIFSLGDPTAYCAKNDNDDWGSTAELISGERGLPEAVVKRKTLGQMCSSELLGCIDPGEKPKIGPSNINRISERLGHQIGNRSCCSPNKCRMKFLGHHCA